MLRHSLRCLLGFFALTLFSLSILPGTSHASSAPVIYSAFPSTINSTNATITWTTDSLSTSTVDYGITSGYGSASSSAISTLSHSVTLTGLTASTTYHFSVLSGNGAGQSSSTDQTFTTVQSCTYYVDSVSGSDLNLGTTPDAPFQHLAKVSAITLSNGSTICLKRGSYFTDQLIIGIAGNTRDNITVEDYGPVNLAKPIIDGSTVIPPSAWAATPGYTNVYQATTTVTPFLSPNGGPDGDGSGMSTTTPYGNYIDGSTIWVNVWECKQAPCTATAYGGNDAVLADQATHSGVSSLSNVQSTAGSVYIPNMTEQSDPATSTTNNQIVIYLHTSDNSNPQTNGYTYSYASKDGQLVIAGDNAVIRNIVAKKGDENNGEIVQYSNNGSAGNGAFYGIEADQGSKHNMYCTGGCTVNNSSFGDGFYPDGDAMLVPFDQTPTGTSAICNNCQFFAGYSSPYGEVSAFTSHTGSGVFGPIVFNGGVLEGINGASPTGISASTLSMTFGGLTCLHSFGCINTSGTTTVQNTQVINDAVPITISTNSFNTIGNFLACGIPQHGLINLAANSTTTVATSTFYIPGTSFNGGSVLYDSSAANAFITLLNSIIDSSKASSGTWATFQLSSSSIFYTGDYNAFLTSDLAGPQFGSNYYNFSQWQSLFGFDAHTTTTLPAGGGNNTATSTACGPGALVLSGPSSGNVNAASANFTVTPNRAFTGLVTISPTGTGSTGLTPTTLTFNNSSSPQTFTVTPLVSGSIALTPFIISATTSPAFVMATSTAGAAAAGTPSLASTSLTYNVSATVSGAPQNVTATAGNGQATISFGGPASNGGSAITSYTVTSSPGGFATTSLTSPVTITGLSNGTPYTFAVTALNGIGTSASSTASNSITPTTLPALTTQAAMGITTTGATLNGTLTALNDVSVSQSGFIYGTDPALAAVLGTTTIGVQSATTTLSSVISSLTCNTTYYFNSYAVNSSGTAYGTPIVSFTTLACPVTATPMVTYSSFGGGGSVSASDLASILAPSAATTAYLNSLNGNGTANVSNTSVVAQSQQGSVSGATFDQSLSEGSTGPDVKALQQFLNSHGYIVAKTGPGSAGNETDVFGSATKAALETFQSQNGIPAIGLFGPMTMSAINSILSTNTVSAANAQGTGSTQTSASYNFTRDLQLGSSGNDVKALQQYLNANGFVIAASGAGSPGEETTLFGALTQAALAKFQASKGISPASGYFGPVTRAYVQNHQ